jgi:hypothetical protein
VIKSNMLSTSTVFSYSNSKRKETLNISIRVAIRIKNISFRCSHVHLWNLAPALKIENPLQKVCLSWNFQELVILVKNTYGKNFSPIRRTRAEFWLSHGPFRVLRRNPKALVLQELESSTQFQIYASIHFLWVH